MGEEALLRRLGEIDMSEYDSDKYEGILSEVSTQIAELRVILEGVEAKQKERAWLTLRATPPAQVIVRDVNYTCRPIFVVLVCVLSCRCARKPISVPVLKLFCIHIVALFKSSVIRIYDVVIVGETSITSPPSLKVRLYQPGPLLG